MEPADVLGGAAASHIPVIVNVLEGIGDHRYEFMSAGASLIRCNGSNSIARSRVSKFELKRLQTRKISFNTPNSGGR
jgi:hypothetical protein